MTTSSKCVTNSRKWGPWVPDPEIHYNYVIMSAMVSQITSLTIVYSTVYSRRRSKRTSKLRVTGLCEGNSPVTGEFPAQRASNAENVSIWWSHNGPQRPDGNTGHPLTNWQWAIQWHTPLHSISQIKTHWGRATHICVSEIIIIGSDNGLSPGRRQAIFWTNVGILLIGPLGINFNEILIEINTFSFKKMYLKISSAKWRLFRLGLNVLRMSSHTKTHIGHWAIRSYWYKWSSHSVWRFSLKEASEHKILNFR